MSRPETDREEMTLQSLGLLDASVRLGPKVDPGAVVGGRLHLCGGCRS